MRDFHTWNVSLGRWFGVRVRVHALFFVLGLVVLFAAPAGATSLYGALLGMLAGSVLVHEAGHCLVARVLGGRPHEIMLWPLGGLVQIRVPQSPPRECAVALAGPLFNLLAALAAVAGLIAVGQEPWPALSLFTLPAALTLNSWAQLSVGGLLGGVAWINLWMAAINLLPALPMDGGRALRGALWMTMSYRRAASLAAGAAQCTGVVLCGVALAMSSGPSYTWMPLVFLGIFLFFGARRHVRRRRVPYHDDWTGDYDLSPADSGLELDGPEPYFPLKSGAGGPSTETLQPQLVRQREYDEAEEDRLDEILARVHQEGIESLSPEERDFLDRVSRRYRDRSGE